MESRKVPRYQGRITSWKDDQGFGFITPNGGGQAVFVHATAFSRRGERPAGNEIVTYNLAVGERGQPRAENVAFYRARTARPVPPGGQRGLPLVLAACFSAFLAACLLTGKLPRAAGGLYLGISVLTYIVYAWDKAAARNGAERIREDHLHLLALAGGWPGAVLAQRFLRHKSSKTAFRTVFWCTVAANCGVLAVLLWLGGPAGLSG